MVTHIFSITKIFPELVQRAVTPLSAIPVFFDDRQVAKTSLNKNGEFPIPLPYKVERQIGKGKIYFLPLFENVNRNRDPAKVRHRITGIRLTIASR